MLENAACPFKMYGNKRNVLNLLLNMSLGSSARMQLVSIFSKISKCRQPHSLKGKRGRGKEGCGLTRIMRLFGTGCPRNRAELRGGCGFTGGCGLLIHRSQQSPNCDMIHCRLPGRERDEQRCTWDWVGVAYSGAMTTGISLRCCLRAVPDFRLPTHSTSPDHVWGTRGVTYSDQMHTVELYDTPRIEVSFIHNTRK